MRTMKIITKFAAFLFIALPLTAQDTTKPFYFPYKTGDGNMHILSLGHLMPTQYRTIQYLIP